MKLVKLAIVSLLLLAYNHPSWGKIKGEEISQHIGYEYPIESKVLAEKRSYLVHLPEGYEDSEKHYPVIYLLDGDSHFRHTASAMFELQDYQRMPQAILVGIPNNQGTRERDLSRNKEKFLAFIEGELIPLIDNKYRTQNHNTLFGHSLAGYFTINAMAENHNKFTNYIGASPHLASPDEVKQKLVQLLENGSLNSYNAYFTMADKLGDGERRVNDFNDFVEILEKQAPKELDWKYQRIDQQEHMTTPYLTIYKGLTYVFSDYQAPRFLSSKDFEAWGGIKTIENFYANRGKKYSLDTQVPVAVIRRLANMYVRDNKPEEAIKLLISFIKNSPESMQAHFSMARVYQGKGDKKLALASYQLARALLKPEDSWFKNFISEQIEKLKAEI